MVHEYWLNDIYVLPPKFLNLRQSSIYDASIVPTFFLKLALSVKGFSDYKSHFFFFAPINFCMSIAKFFCTKRRCLIK